MSHPEIPPEEPATPWADHVIRGLKNPKFFERKVGDLSVDELQAIEEQWLPRVREVWDHVNPLQRADAEAFEAAIAYFKYNPASVPQRLRTVVHPDPVVYYTPEEIRAKFKRISPYVGPFVPDSVREMAKDHWGPDHASHGHWWWDDGSGIFQCELLLCDMDAETCEPDGYVSIIPLKDGRYRLNFVAGYGGPEDLIFPTAQAAKQYLDALLAAATPELPYEPPYEWICERIPEVREQMKGFAPPIGPDYPPHRHDLNWADNWVDKGLPQVETARWVWNDDVRQWELNVWNIGRDFCDPADYVAIRPLEDGGYALIFAIGLKWPEDDFDPEDLVFQSREEAKAVLDTLLAIATPEIPIP